MNQLGVSLGVLTSGTRSVPTHRATLFVTLLKYSVRGRRRTSEFRRPFLTDVNCDALKGL